jgi:acetyltransferase-like isoleucine patch superfamily enzyme
VGVEIERAVGVIALEGLVGIVDSTIPIKKEGLAVSYVEKLKVKVRRHETPFYAMVYRMAKSLGRGCLPMPGKLASFLYYERLARRAFFKRLMSMIYYQPLFRSRCVHVGENLKLENSIQGMPLIIGDLKIHIGDNVRMNDVVTFIGLKVLDEPVLRIGDNSDISDRVSIFVASEVSIGKNCIISSQLILDNPSHPVDPARRRENEPFTAADIAPVIIEDDAWLARGSIVLKGVRVGRGAIVSAGAVVTRDVEPFTIVAGNPAVKVREIPH